MNRNGNGVSMPATLRPGDFPLGSMLSRAAARSMLAKREKPQRDQDALCLYRGEVLLNARMDPSYAELERTAAYARGKELSEESDTDGADLRLASSTPATRTFHVGFGRTPQRDDLLRFSDVELIYHPGWRVHWVRDFIEAWGRQIPAMQCPLRLIEKRIFHHLGPCAIRENNGQEWEESVAHLHRAEWCWSQIEEEATGCKQPEHVQMPTIAGVTFTGLTWRPATKRELLKFEIEPSGGLLGLLVEAASRVELEAGVVGVNA